jgi:hypothetical protein
MVYYSGVDFTIYDVEYIECLQGNYIFFFCPSMGFRKSQGWVSSRPFTLRLTGRLATFGSFGPYQELLGSHGSCIISPRIGDPQTWMLFLPEVFGDGAIFHEIKDLAIYHL